MTTLYLQVKVSISGSDLETYRFPAGDVHIGRGSDNQILLDNPGVSRRHAKLIFDGQNVEIMDLQSGNGTFVNGKQVERASVQPSDTLRVGKFTLAVRTTHEAPEESSPQRATPAASSEDVSGGTVFLRPDERIKILQQSQQRKTESPVTKTTSTSKVSVASKPPSSNIALWIIIFSAGFLAGLLAGWLLK